MILRGFAGPLAWPTWTGRAIGLAVVGVLTIGTEVGGIFVWPAVGIAAKGGRWPVAVAASLLAYLIGSVVVRPVAAHFGRVALPCVGHPHLAPRSMIYCGAHRNYVRPSLAAEIEAIAADYARAHPGERVHYLDAGFPLRGLPLLPHLSHHDGRKLDLALPGDGGSPLGYFGYAPPPAAAACPPRWIDLRWDFDAIQPLVGLELDADRTATLVRAAVARRAVGKILIEPHIEARLQVASAKIRFQGCHAARHDDHLHLQLR